MSDINDNPLVRRYDTSGTYTIDLLSSSFNEAIFSRNHRLAVNVYLGAIVSNDRTIVYWQNNSQPLPS